MVTWTLLPESFPDRDWDALLSRFEDRSFFQSSAWASHKGGLGWAAARLVAGPGPDGARAALQLLRRSLPPFGAVLWGRGGPVGDASCWGPELWKAVRSSAGSAVVYCRLCSYRTLDRGDEETMRRAGWTRPARPLDRNSTFVLDLSSGEDALRRGLSANWGHNLRRAEKRCPAVRPWLGARPGELAALYQDMERYKGLRTQHGERELESLLSRCAGDIALFRADDEEGRPLALRACAVQGDKAWDLLAASSEEGRRRYASYALLWALLRDCLRRGVRSYDLGGADPGSAKGVFDFKKGTGAAFLEYLGEWERSGPAALRRPVSAAIALKLRGL